MTANSRQLQRIGILTGGGDCPGLNAVIRVVTKAAITKLGLEVFGIEDGFQGLIDDRMRPLSFEDVSNILTTGGTILGTSNKANPARYAVGKDADGQPIFKDVRDQVVENIRQRGIDAVVCIGGDGTMSGAADLIERGVPCIGVPKTIDNDLAETEVTFGFQTAVEIATDALDRIHSTASSHHRVMVVELMGRNAGWLTVHAGLASGSDIIVIPEIPFDLDHICETCVYRSQHGKRFTLVAVSEGAKPRGGAQVVRKVVADSPDPIRLGGVATMLSDEIQNRTGLESRATILGHVQRGGTPTGSDRVLAMGFGHRAIQLVATREFNNCVVMKNGEISFVPIERLANRQRVVPLDHPLLGIARAVGTSLGADR
jgi:6-phosphofructokinase 1